jgi:hypothetical protein
LASPFYKDTQFGFVSQSQVDPVSSVASVAPPPPVFSSKQFLRRVSL